MKGSTQPGLAMKKKEGNEKGWVKIMIHNISTETACLRPFNHPVYEN